MPVCESPSIQDRLAPFRPGFWLLLLLLLTTGAARTGVAGTPVREASGQPELLLQSGHGSAILDLAWHPQGDRLASASRDRTLRLWDVRKRRTYAVLRGHEMGVRSVSWSPDGALLASGGYEGTIRIWDPRQQRQLRVMMGRASAVNGVAWHPRGTLLASSGGGATHIWNAKTGEQQRVLDSTRGGGGAVAWSPDGGQLATDGGGNKLCVWDTATWELRWTGECTQTIRGIAWSPDGRSLAVGTGLFGQFAGERAPTYRGGVEQWEAVAGKRVRVLTQEDCFVARVVWHPSRPWVATVTHAGTVRLWNSETGAEEQERFQGGTPDSFYALDWSPDGRQLAVATTDARIRLWETLKGQKAEILGGHSLELTAVAWSPDGRELATAGNGAPPRIWDTRTGELRGSLSHLERTVLALTWRPDGKVLAAVTDDGMIELWDVQTLRPVQTLKGAAGPPLPPPAATRAPEASIAAWSPDGKILAIVSRDAPVSFWDPDTGQRLSGLRNFSETVGRVTWSPDGRFFAATGGGRVWIWETTGAAAQGWKLTHTLAGGGSIQWSPDSKALAGSLMLPPERGMLRTSLCLWDARTGEVRRSIPHPRLAEFAWTPDGNHILTTTSISPPILAISRDAKSIVATFPGAPPMLWDIATGAGKPVLRMGGLGMKFPQFTRDLSSLRLAAAAPDGSVRIWNELDAAGERWVALTALRTERRTEWMAVTANGHYDGSPGSGELVSWRAEDQLYPAARFENRFRRPRSVRQALAGVWEPAPPLGSGDIPPACRFLDAEMTVAADAREVKLTLLASDDRSVRSAEVFVNGRPVLLDDRSAPEALSGAIADLAERRPASLPRGVDAGAFPPRHRAYQISRLAVPLPPGEELILVRATVFDDQGYNADPVEILIRRPGAPAVRGRLFVLCAGVSRYRDPAYSLAFPAGDARAVASVFAGQKELYTRVEVDCLTDAQATGNALRARLKAIKARSRPEDTVVLYLAGHGLRDEAGNYCFGTYELDVSSNRRLLETTLTGAQLAEWLGPKLSARQVIVFADTCHSGKIPVPAVRAERMMSPASGVVLLASATPDQLAQERARLGHGVFTYALLEGLRGHADPSTPFVRFNTLAEYVARRVHELDGPRQQVSISDASFPLTSPFVRARPANP